MKAVQVVAPGQAQFVETAKPIIKPGHVLVRCSRLALCGSDIRMLYYAPKRLYPYPPGTTGHEMVGTVEAVAPDVDKISVGDQVLALAPGHQAMAEYYLAEQEHVIRLPAGKPLEQLLQAQQLGTVLFASQRLPNIISKNIAIIGQGSAGLWFAYHLRRMGARRVIALDLEEYRLKLSTHFGATHTLHNTDRELIDAVRSITGGELADVVIEAAGEIESINLAVDLVRQGGDILYFGVPRQENFTYSFNQLFHKCCRVSTIVGAAVEPNQTSTRIAIDLIASGAADGLSMITHRIPFTNVLEAYEIHRKREDGAVKIVIEMPD
jgi:L-iditol 2-dehydrogenase